MSDHNIIFDVAITGASGFVGNQLLMTLSEKKRTIKALYRSSLPEAGNAFHLHQCDILQAEDNPFKDVKCVVHLAQDTRKNEDSLGMLRKVLCWCEQAKVQRLVFLSYLGASEKSHFPKIKEKFIGEQLVLNASIPQRLVVRAPVLFREGQENYLLKKISLVTRYPWFFPVAHEKRKIFILHVSDLCKQLFKVINTNFSLNMVVLPILGKAYSYEDVLQAYAKGVLGKAKFPLRGVFALPFHFVGEHFAQPKEKLPSWEELFCLSGVKEVEKDLWNKVYTEKPDSSEKLSLFCAADLKGQV